MADYDRLCIKVLCALTGELLPDTSWHIPERSEQRIAIAVCDATGMTPERWDELSKDERIPWLHKTLKALEKQPAPNVWIESDDLPIYRPDLKNESCFDALVGEVLYWRNGVLPFYWRGAYHPGDFQRRTADPLRKCLVWLDARGFNHLSSRLQS